MATEYGTRHKMNAIAWGFTLEQAEAAARANTGVVVVAREVSEPRIVSIRA